MNVGQELAIQTVEHELRWTPKAMRFERLGLLRMLRAMKRWYK